MNRQMIEPDIKAIRQACADIRESGHICNCGEGRQLPCRSAIKAAAASASKE